VDRDRQGVGVHREECSADRVVPDRWQIRRDDGAQERVRDLGEDAGAVPAVLLGTLCTAVIEVAQRRQAGVDDVAARRTAEGRDERDSARVVLEARAVQPLRFRRCDVVERPAHGHRPHCSGGSRN